MNFARTETAYPSNIKDAAAMNGTYSADTGDEVASFLLGAIDNGQISTDELYLFDTSSVCGVTCRTTGR